MDLDDRQQARKALEEARIAVKLGDKAEAWVSIAQAYIDMDKTEAYRERTSDCRNRS